MWSSIDTAIGITIDPATNNASFFIPLSGIGIGLTIGSYLDKKVRREGNVI
ncbi:hypothetical protein ACFLTP_00445 [Chloroflexota bacterium]